MHSEPLQKPKQIPWHKKYSFVEVIQYLNCGHFEVVGKVSWKGRGKEVRFEVVLKWSQTSVGRGEGRGEEVRFEVISRWSLTSAGRGGGGCG